MEKTEQKVQFGQVKNRKYGFKKNDNKESLDFRNSKMQKPTETKTISVLDKRLPPLLPPVTINIWWNKSYRQKKLLTHEIMVGRWKPLYLPQDSCHKHARICHCWGAPAHWIAPFCVKILYQSCWLGTLWYRLFTYDIFCMRFHFILPSAFNSRQHFLRPGQVGRGWNTRWQGAPSLVLQWSPSSK